MADAKELISALRDLFRDLCDNDSELKSIAEKLETGTYSDAHDYSIRIGELLSQSFSDILTEDIFPQITQEIARKVIPSLLGTDHKMVSEACVTVQEHLNEQAGLGLKAVEPEFNVSRAYDLADKYVSYEDYESARKVLQEPVENFSQSIPDDAIRRNADFHWRSGMSPKIIRRAERGACKWCRSLAGTYEYKDVRDTGNDVYRRHENCRCMVDYVPANSKKRQDVWTKAEWEGDDPEARKKAIQEKEDELQRNNEIRASNRRKRSAAVERIQKELGFSPKGASIWYNQNKEYIDKYGMDYMLDYERNNGRLAFKKNNNDYSLKSDKNEQSSSPSFDDLVEALKKNWDEIGKLKEGLSKSEIAQFLKENGFSSKYFICQTPKVLENNNLTEQTGIFFTRENIAYCISAHNNQLTQFDYFHIRDVLTDYDLLLHGDHRYGTEDYKFYKLYTFSDGIRGIEIVIAKESVNDELIIHVNHVGRSKNKAVKKYKKLSESSDLIDKKR